MIVSSLSYGIVQWKLLAETHFSVILEQRTLENCPEEAYAFNLLNSKCPIPPNPPELQDEELNSHLAVHWG